MGPDNKPVIVSEHLPNAHMRLFGGAQYHRAMAEFRAGALSGAGCCVAACLGSWLPVQPAFQSCTCCCMPVHCTVPACSSCLVSPLLLLKRCPVPTGLTALQASAPSAAPTSRARRLSTPAVSMTSTMVRVKLGEWAASGSGHGARLDCAACSQVLQPPLPFHGRPSPLPGSRPSPSPGSRPAPLQA